jgi:hypothetical protein
MQTYVPAKHPQVQFQSKATTVQAPSDAKVEPPRRCTGRTKKGKPCQAWAIRGHPRPLCMSHAGRHHRGPLPPPWVRQARASREMVSDFLRASSRFRERDYNNCTCEAYRFPHRPRSGRCETYGTK